ncbi:Uncharacterised protein g4886 [Pycnogonum litorale]
MKRHNLKHTGEKPFLCSYCDKSFGRQDKLKQHIRIHTNDKPYKCDQCQYTCSEKNSLTLHRRTHTGEKPFQCQICSYSARTSTHLIVHIRTHTGDAPYKCNVCDAKFKVISDVKRHKSIHYNVKSFECNLCDYKCNFKSNLMSHRRRKHVIANNNREVSPHHHGSDHRNELERKSVCTGENQQQIHAVNSPPILKKTKSKKSIKKNPLVCSAEHQCSICGERFVRADSLRCHLTHHNVNDSHPKNQEVLVNVVNDHRYVSGGNSMPTEVTNSETPCATSSHNTKLLDELFLDSEITVYVTDANSARNQSSGSELNLADTSNASTNLMTDDNSKPQHDSTNSVSEF